VRDVGAANRVVLGVGACVCTRSVVGRAAACAGSWINAG
jgi:hypothetical protein